MATQKDPSKGFGSPSQKKPLRKPNTFKDKTKRTPKKRPVSYAFPNILADRNNNAQMNLVWAMNFTILNTELEGAPGSKHYLLAVVDHYARKCILSKVFRLNKGRGTIKSDKVIKQLEALVKLRGLKEEVIVHTDNGPEFTSKVYHDFSTNHPLLIGSTSIAGNPQHNSIVESWFRKFKQENYAKVKIAKRLIKAPNLLILPKSVTSTQKLQTWINQKVNFINFEVPGTYLAGYTPDKQENHFLAAKLDPPDVLLASRNYYTVQTDVLQNIEDYNHQVRNFTDSTAWKNANVQQQQDLIAKGVKYTIQQNIDLKQQNVELQSKISNIDTNIQKLLPKPRKSHKEQILRDPLTADIYKEIIQAPKPINTERKSWSRFKVISTLLYYTGMRIGEAGKFTEEMIVELIQTNSIIIFQSKTAAERRLFVSEQAVAQLEELLPDRRIVFEQPLQTLYPFEGKGSTSLINLINKFLQPYREKYGLNLRSHSYRVNYVTQTLKFSSVETAQSLVGHKDIRSTLKYNRTVVRKDDAIKLLGKSL